MIRLSLLIVGVAVSAFAETQWHISNADLRFELEISESPSEACAGIIALIPDGGLLPHPTAEAVVVDEAGKELKSGGIWHNPHEGYGVVFEKPEGRRVFVYLREGARKPVPPELCPSLLLCTQVGNASLSTAHQLASDNNRARLGFVERIGEVENLFGEDENYSSYYTGYLTVAKAGRYYIATISDDGSEVRINGTELVAWPGIHSREGGNKGQHGDSIELTAGRHRVEYFHFEKAGPQEANLLWRKPDDKADALPQTVSSDAFVHSGKARLLSGSYRNGAPVAAFTARCESYLWLGEKPVNLYQLHALADGVWDFGNGLQLDSRDVAWLIEGSEPREISFSAGRSKFSRPVYYDRTPGGASINQPGQREAYRAALLARCRAVAAAKRPCADWSADLWALLFGVIEPHEGRALLDEIFQRSRPDVLTLKKEDRWRLEDIYFDLLRENDAQRALSWVERFVREEQDNARRFDWQLVRIELALYELNDPAQAKKFATELESLASAGGADAAARLLVRRGDIERDAGNIDAARKLYAAAQERSPNAKKDWRAAAVRQSSYYEEVRNLIDQVALAEARALMRKWEVELPLSKLEGDYVLAEAQYWIAASQHARAVRLLQSYRKQTDMSPFLPRAMELERDCLLSLRRYDNLAALVADIQKRFPTLPLAKESAQLLADTKQPVEEPLRREQP